MRINHVVLHKKETREGVGRTILPITAEYLPQSSYSPSYPIKPLLIFVGILSFVWINTLKIPVSFQI